MKSIITLLHIGIEGTIIFEQALYAKEIAMNIDATLLLQGASVYLVISLLLSYYLGRRKTSTPMISALVGVLLALIPPLGLIYLAFLTLKSDYAERT
ncbi:hypothetical protein OFO16_22925 [Vibrio natriegens]|uniref:hypothetical protein n=1 Tax=Vibrio natriegens TaxID=691 RepID=UPI0021E92858|nr:hypothetical protein [Vibrio natriegens]UYI49223.1 hypothetical protein OFO16_22925 [Vibrio natriegens]